ncbi:HIT domain-containing protein [Pseudodesulfovibrio senegalensis]|nr:HIT domain-containing protein [Pseudodesulfovibrio senegalensis]
MNQLNDLIDYLTNRMRMSHIYQPLMIRSLVEADGTATIRQLAHAFIIQDESQLKYYEDRIKKMPLRILKKNGVIDRQGDLVALKTGKLTFEQRAQIKMLCDQKMQEFIVKRGLSIWDYRLLDTPVSGSVYYEAMKESGGRCALCGATKDERPLDLDHIIPRSKGGKSTKDNLQVLCSRCNRTKGNKDDTDFRKLKQIDSLPGCKFCFTEINPAIVVEEHNSVFAILDKYPVSEGHHLIIPKRHVADWFTMTTQERREGEELIRVLKKRIEIADKTITGFNVGMNTGESAGQTIFHAHIHLIPRRDGDTPHPRGGVRGAIPEKMDYGD